MDIEATIRAWKNPDFRESDLCRHPAGPRELSEDVFTRVSGGRGKNVITEPKGTFWDPTHGGIGTGVGIPF